MPSFQERKEVPPPHIPAFLPAFPDKHTYVHTPQFQGHEEDPAKQTQVGAGAGGGCVCTCVCACVCVMCVRNVCVCRV